MTTTADNLKTQTETFTADKLKTLADIASVFNAHQLTWAIGASLMLFLRGRVDRFHDIDVFVSEHDIDKARELLACMGRELPFVPHPCFRSRHFHQFVVGETDVDLIAGYVIVSNGVPYECPLKPDDIDTETEVLGQRIPLYSLAAWQHYYDLMGKTQKSKLCE